MTTERTKVREVVPITIEGLKKAGFVEAPSEVQNKRVIASVAAMEKEGKTHFTLTGPQPLVYFDIDAGAEGVIEAHKAAGKEILVYRLRVVREEDQALWEKQWEDLKDKLVAAWGLPSGTVIIDTFSEVYELVRLVKFGKLSQVSSYQYDRTNKEVRELIRMAYESNMSTIFVHKMRPVYINDKRSGDYEPKGWGDMPFNVQANLFPFSMEEDGKTVFKVRVKDCRLNAKMKGKVYDCGEAGEPPKAGDYTLEKLIEMMHRRPSGKKADLGEESGKKKVDLSGED